jgi:tetratricopeptide (TPR) repeat protein
VLRESLGLFRQLRDDSGEANALNYLGLLAMSTGNLDTAIEHFEQSLQRWRILGNQQTIATDLANLGEAHHLSGSLDEAEPLYREALALFESLSDPGGRGFVVNQLGLLALDCGDTVEAHKLLTESLRLRWTAGLRGAAADTLEALAEATWRQGDSSFAATLLQVANVIREETGVARQPVYETRFRRLADAVSGVSGLSGPLDIDKTVAAAFGVPPTGS